MKAQIFAAMILLAGTVGFAQKSDRLPVKSHAARTPLPRSGNADVVTAALKRKSSSASDLTQIERSSMVHPGGTKTSAAKGFHVPNNVTAYKNKPMNGSHSNRNAGKQIPTVRKKTGKAG
jgi:hypothetical protein